MNTNALFDDLKSQISQYREKIKRLVVTERDRRALMIGGVGAALLLIYIIFQVFSSGSGRLEKQAEAMRQDMNKLNSLKAEYNESKRRAEQIAREVKTGNHDLVSLIENAVIEAQIPRGSFSINSRTPASTDLYEEKMVDVEVKKVSLERAVAVLYQIQSKPTFLKVSKFSVRTRFDNVNLVDVSFRVSAYEFKQEV